MHYVKIDDSKISQKGNRWVQFHSPYFLHACLLVAYVTIAINFLRPDQLKDKTDTHMNAMEYYVKIDNEG